MKTSPAKLAFALSFVAIVFLTSCTRPGPLSTDFSREDPNSTIVFGIDYSETESANSFDKYGVARRLDRSETAGISRSFAVLITAIDLEKGASNYSIRTGAPRRTLSSKFPYLQFSHEYFCSFQADDEVDKFYSCKDGGDIVYFAVTVPPGAYRLRAARTKLYDRTRVRDYEIAAENFNIEDTLRSGEIKYIGNFVLRDVSEKYARNELLDKRNFGVIPVAFAINNIEKRESAADRFIQARFPMYQTKH